MNRNSKDEETIRLAELRSSLRKMSEIYGKLAGLMMKKFTIQSASLNLAETIEGAESRLDVLAGGAEETQSRFETFARVLSRFLGLRKKLHTGLRVLGNNLKNLEKAESAGEISTLMGLNVLTDYREYNKAATEVMESYKTELLPVIPELRNLLDIGAQVNETAEMMNRLFNYDPVTGEDDFTRMMIALRDHNVKEFDELYKKMKQRIAIEERR